MFSKYMLRIHNEILDKIIVATVILTCFGVNVVLYPLFSEILWWIQALLVSSEQKKPQKTKLAIYSENCTLMPNNLFVELHL